MRRLPALALLALAPSLAAQDLVVGSKNFTEGRLLGEIVTQWLNVSTSLDVRHAADLGGTQVCWAALQSGEVDLVVDYTGTGWTVLLGETEVVADPLEAFLRVQEAFSVRHDVEWTAPFGLNNTYALALRRDRAEALGATRVSDLVDLEEPLRTGFSIEFMNREDGWPGLRAHYPGLSLEPRGMEHGLAYEALDAGQLDVVDAYSTDGKLLRYDVVVLEDDRGFFPPYSAAPMVRGEALREHPELRGALWRLAFTIDDARAMELNHRVEVGGQTFEAVAQAFLTEAGLLDDGTAAAAPDVVPRDERGLLHALVRDRAQLLRLTLEHLGLVLVALLLACAIAIPLGVWLSDRPRLQRPFLGTASILQTVPSLALLAFLITIPWLGLGARSAVLALVLYALLPILRNTVTGLGTVDPDLVDAARGLGLSRRQVLWRVQVPLALRTVLAGVRTAAVLSVGVATLAAFISAGGLGGPILQGLYLNDASLILSGAIPAAVLALLVDGLLGLVQHLATPRGLRVRAASDERRP